jgi:L-ribulose-5-phosphate 4-epimerase
MIVDRVISVNKSLLSEGLVLFTWGNASARSEKYDHIFFIKPSGIPFSDLNTKNISCVDLTTGLLKSGSSPSVDTPTHVALYKGFPEIRSVIHTHSKYCTIFAQAKKSIPCLGTTHADYFYGDIPVIKDLSNDEIDNNYEENTGLKIVEHFKKNNISHKNMKAALCPSHGVFVWGETPEEALKNSIILENIAEMAYKTMILYKEVIFNPKLLDKHFLRKHGNNKYYGQ